MVSKEDVLSNSHKFLSKRGEEDLSGCIPFLGYLDRDGYGQFQFRSDSKKKNIQAHRAAYIIHTGEELCIDDVVMHSCDNPICVNVLHLSKGTQADNVKDMVMKGRCAIGVNNGRYIHGRYCKDKKVVSDYAGFEKGHIPVNMSIPIDLAYIVKDEIENREKGVSLISISKKYNVKYQFVRDISCGKILKFERN